MNLQLNLYFKPKINKKKTYKNKNYQTEEEVRRWCFGAKSKKEKSSDELPPWDADADCSLSLKQRLPTQRGRQVAKGLAFIHWRIVWAYVMSNGLGHSNEKLRPIKRCFFYQWPNESNERSDLPLKKKQRSDMIRVWFGNAI